MPAQMTEIEVQQCTDVDLLWTEFMAARRSGDEPRADLLRDRMALLQEQRALEEMDDDQLIAQIAHLESQRDREGDVDLTMDPPGPVARLSRLLEEATRRGL